MDTEMDRLHLHVDTPCAKSASKKSVFGSLERSMDKLLCMLTPKKKRSFDEPRSVKVLTYLSDLFHSVHLLCLLEVKLVNGSCRVFQASLLHTRREQEEFSD